MADPLSQLRQFHINGREIKEHNGYIIFGDHGWPKNVNTNYQIYSTEDDPSKKDYYTLECLLYFLKNMDVAHHHYVKQAGAVNTPVVHRPDRKNLLAYLKGDQQTATGIDKNAPIPSLRLPVSDIYRKDHHSSSGEPQASTSSQQSNDPNDLARGDSHNAAAKKRHHDPEVEKRIREEFAARLYEPSSKKVAPIIPAEVADKGGEATEVSAAINKFGAEKLAAMRAKHLAVKRTTIVDADTDLAKSGSGSTGDLGSKEAELLIAMDSDPSKLIKSKEKVWRTRSTILQAQTKDFAKTILPMLSERPDDAKRKSLHGPGHNPSAGPGGPGDPHMNSYQQQTHQQNASNQRNAYNRYDQERFVKLDIGVEIDTKKSFVAGVDNGLSANQPSTTSSQRTLANGPPANPLGPHPHHPHHQNHNPSHPGHQHPAHHRSEGSIGRHSYGSTAINSQKSSKRATIPIIIIPATNTSLINMYNAAAILRDLTYVEANPNKGLEPEMMISRQKPDGSQAIYMLMDNPIKLDPEEWKRVVAVFVQGPAWQFKGWPWGGSPVEIFSQIKGFHLKWDETKVDNNVSKWNVQILELSRNKRHLDKASLLKFWSSLDSYMMKYKSFLRF